MEADDVLGKIRRVTTSFFQTLLTGNRHFPTRRVGIARIGRAHSLKLNSTDRKQAISLVHSISCLFGVQDLARFAITQQLVCGIFMRWVSQLIWTLHSSRPGGRGFDVTTTCRSTWRSAQGTLTLTRVDRTNSASSLNPDVHGRGK